MPKFNSLKEVYDYINQRTTDNTGINNGKKFNGKCPCCGKTDKHENDKHLEVTYKYSAKHNNIILLHCHKNDCDFKDIVKALDLEPEQLFGDTFDNKNKKGVKKMNNDSKKNEIDERTHYYNYDIDENIIDAKKVIKIFDDGSKRPLWYLDGKYGLNKTKINLYNLDEIKKAPTVYIVEGEKDADTLKRLKLTATTSPIGGGAGWKNEYNKYLKDKDIIIIYDNDDTGEKYKDKIVKSLYSIAKTITVINPLSLDKKLKIKGDISDIVFKLGDEETLKRLNHQLSIDTNIISKNGVIVNDKYLDIVKILPEWLEEQPQKNGKVKAKVLTKKYINTFAKNNDLRFVNGAFYNSFGETLQKIEIQKTIQNDIAIYIEEWTENVVTTLYNSVKRHIASKAPELHYNKVFLKKSTLVFDESGNFTEDFEDKTPTLHRFNLEYNKNAEQPTNFLKLINDMLYEEDIETVQQFLGLCLVPITKNEKALILIGEGQDGKSTLLKIIKQIFENKGLSLDLSELFSNRFLPAQLQHKLICADDDVQAKAIMNTNKLKTLFSGDLSITAERKGEDHFEFKPYARFIVLGNEQLQTGNNDVFAFYRRQLLVYCKPKGDRSTDENLYTKILNEIDGVFNWMLEGLSKVLKNNGIIYISDRIKQNVEEAQREQDPLTLFFDNTNYIQYGTEAQATTQELYYAYCSFCDKNVYEPMLQRSFSTAIKRILEKRNVIRSNKTINVKGEKVRGYKGINCVVVNTAEEFDYLKDKYRNKKI